MDVVDATFHRHLPWILYELASCCFVSLDLELSGIAISPDKPGGEVQTLQERYVKVKAAAEKYQVLQVGLTICRENLVTGKYILIPYNFNLSPNTFRESEISRDWTFQSRAVEFLLANGFSIDIQCKYGVPYLSREEEKEAIAKATERLTRQTTGKSLNIKESDHESLEFVQAVRQVLTSWLAEGENHNAWVNIPPPTGSLPGMPKILSKMHKMLVHHLIESEYPTLAARSHSSFMTIEPLHPERDKKAQEARLERNKARIQQCVGFRWIVEALVGGNLTGIEDGAFKRTMDTKAVRPRYTPDTPKELSMRVKQRLMEHRPILVGHNIFTDLVYFCRCFFGPLPDTVGEFQIMVHDLFPVIVDTKYLATHDCGSVNPPSSLVEINQDLSHIWNPVIAIDPLHVKYSGQELNHEAGFDSMLTATAFLKLSAMLAGGSFKRNKIKQHQPNGGMKRSQQGRSPVKKSPEDFFAAENVKSLDMIANGWLHTRGSTLEETGSAEVAHKVRNGELIPRLGSDFWNVYSNRLRAFGTKERVVQLGVQEEQEKMMIEFG
ncbi:hypothetical protein N7510_007859 [Penicillium lagena]|uniref:uncharacterized protein n=1 Tax=Penicillium lagena TaxID=94218 RepID=UPI002540F85E|nr:uncharacterized protein N7510_007859 [Penicillium lagena]KAJ5611140.1 hypothetical protein N7510_007859 [Penicillium lagena]